MPVFYLVVAQGNSTLHFGGRRKVDTACVFSEKTCPPPLVVGSLLSLSLSKLPSSSHLYIYICVILSPSQHIVSQAIPLPLERLHCLAAQAVSQGGGGYLPSFSAFVRAGTFCLLDPTTATRTLMAWHAIVQTSTQRHLAGMGWDGFSP